jgi:hypothetical protein
LIGNDNDHDSHKYDNWGIHQHSKLGYHLYTAKAIITVFFSSENERLKTAINLSKNKIRVNDSILFNIKKFVGVFFVVHFRKKMAFCGNSFCYIEV